MSPENKVMCDECDWIGDVSEILQAENPFHEGEEITGCPHCRSIVDFPTLCEEPGCLNEASCWRPQKPGGCYRLTCRDHAPKDRRVK